MSVIILVLSWWLVGAVMGFLAAFAMLVWAARQKECDCEDCEKCDRLNGMIRAFRPFLSWLKSRL